MRRLAPLFDLAALVLFVALGRREHQLDNDALHFLSTLWPFVLGWAVVAIGVRLYGEPLAWRRWLPTWLGGVALALLLRATLGGEGFVVSFAIVATIVVGAFTGGWRGIAVLVTRRRSSATA